MKISKQTFLSLLICMTVISLSCQKEKLPKATEKGNNTFGCKIDGKVFVPKQALTYPNMPPLRGSYDESSGYMQLNASEPKNSEHNGFQRYIRFDIKNLQSGNNSLNDNNTASVYLFENNQLDQQYETNATTGGTLTITRLDTVANIISGTFSFQAALRPDNSKILNVTNGRFDISYEQ